MSAPSTRHRDSVVICCWFDVLTRRPLSNQTFWWGVPATTTSGSHARRQWQEPEPLVTLAEYLELPLRNGGVRIMMQQCDDVFGMYVGNAAEGQADVTFYGTVAATIATGIPRLTRVGRNCIEIAEYYFVRSRTPLRGPGRNAPDICRMMFPKDWLKHHGIFSGAVALSPFEAGNSFRVRQEERLGALDFPSLLRSSLHALLLAVHASAPQYRKAHLE